MTTFRATWCPLRLPIQEVDSGPPTAYTIFVTRPLMHHLPKVRLRRLQLIVSPDTLLRWHRDLIRSLATARGFR